MSEETVVRQCAPTLAGIKTGSLFPCPYDSREELLPGRCGSLNKRAGSEGAVSAADALSRTTALCSISTAPAACGAI